jgi:hypothetical protein
MNSRKVEVNQYHPPLALSSLEDNTEDVELTLGLQTALGIDYKLPIMTFQ